MPSDDSTLSSRRVVLGGGLAAAPSLLGAATASAQQQQPRRPALQDPRAAYPRPPFPRQEQEWPGLAARMQPRPDHGETSYAGSGRLAGRKALLTGGDSGIGRAAAIAFAREGADVAINYLPAEEEDAREVVALIREAGRKAVALPGDIRDEAFCQRLVAQAVQELGGLDILVNNAARQAAQVSLADISTEQLDATLKTNLYAMFWITKAALPHLQPSGGQMPEAVVNFGADNPMGRPGQPAELATVFVMLASPEASYASGGVFGSTGGRAGP